MRFLKDLIQVARIGSNERARETLQRRAEDIRREFYGCTDPDKAMVLITQLATETKELYEQYPAQIVDNTIRPAWEAALDALAAVENHLKANPSPERQAIFAKVKEAVEGNAPHGTIIHV